MIAPPSKKRGRAAAAAAVTAAAPDAKKQKKRGKPLPPPRAHTAAARVKAAKIAATLATLYPDPPCPLHHASEVQLLVAVMLSAQTTDVKVNQCTKGLFQAAPDAAALAALGADGILPHIRALGLAPTKARNVAATAQMLVEHHGGRVPGDWGALEALPGVGHKTASVVMSMAGHPAFPVDTHVHRLAARWGLSCGRSVEQTEADLKDVWPQAEWGRLHIRVIMFGREHCPAKGHVNKECPVCSWAAV